MTENIKITPMHLSRLVTAGDTTLEFERLPGLRIYVRVSQFMATSIEIEVSVAQELRDALTEALGDG